VLVVELDGPTVEVEAESLAAQQMCRDAGAFEIRLAADAEERAAIWRGRKSAFAAVGRISPDYIVQDGVIPRTKLSEVLHRMGVLAAERGVRVANVFHAGDGNLHPLVLFDGGVPGQEQRAEEVSAAILDLCLEHGGSITGEHGVGFDKAKHMPKMFTEIDLDTMQRVRCAFDPKGVSNPGKIYPTPRLCGEVPRKRRADEPNPFEGKAEIF
jgi:glycolate oxidase